MTCCRFHACFWGWNPNLTQPLCTLLRRLRSRPRGRGSLRRTPHPPPPGWRVTSAVWLWAWALQHLLGGKLALCPQWPVVEKSHTESRVNRGPRLPPWEPPGGGGSGSQRREAVAWPRLTLEPGICQHRSRGPTRWLEEV